MTLQFGAFNPAWSCCGSPSLLTQAVSSDPKALLVTPSCTPTADGDWHICCVLTVAVETVSKTRLDEASLSVYHMAPYNTGSGHLHGQVVHRLELFMEHNESSDYYSNLSPLVRKPSIPPSTEGKVSLSMQISTKPTLSYTRGVDRCR